MAKRTTSSRDGFHVHGTVRRCVHRVRNAKPTSVQWFFVFAMLISLALTAPASATWSIVMVNKRTKEVVIGSATCLTFFDLQKGASVVVPGMGAGAAQSYIGPIENRQTIRLGLRLGTDPVEILQQLEDQDPGHQLRQYGIVDTIGRAVTFTGDQDGPWAGGLIGEDGEIVYAIQGNVLTGEPVVLQAEQAVLNTPGSLAEKLMAGMEAARDMGGDGRCSCSPQDPEGCGSPPPDFEKSAHIGYMVASRIGDYIGPCDSSNGCAAGDYYMNFNFAFMSANDPDPVDLLRDAYEQFKLDMVGVADAVETQVGFDQRSIPADGHSTATMTIILRDLNGDPITTPINSLTVESTPETKGMVQIGDVIDLGGGQYSVEIMARKFEGDAPFVITADDGNRPVILMPNPTLMIGRPTAGVVLGDPVPGLAGQDNDLCVNGGTPGDTVAFFFSLNPGLQRTGCGPLLLDMPGYAGKATVDADGNACVTGFVPSKYSGKAVYLQALEWPSCRRSNVVTWNVPE